MSKKIIFAAVLMLAVIVVFTACGKEDYEVSHTVPGTSGEVIEVYKDNEGNEFVTNVDGDRVPVTSDVDGFYDDINSLVTQTTKPNKDNNKTTTTTTNSSTSSTTTTTSTTESTSNDTTETSTSRPSVVVNDDSKQEAGIKWEDIK